MQELSILWSLLAAVIVLLIPGGALLAWLSIDSSAETSGLGRDQGSLVSRLTDAAGMSIALYSLAAMLAFFTGLRFSPLILGGFYGLCLIALAVAAARRWNNLPNAHRLLRWLLIGLFTFTLTGALVGWRLYQARTLVLPAWVDSVHHTLVVRLIVEQGGLPYNFAPYIDAPFVYHYGFHLITALFSSLSGVSPDQSVLWFGQALNGLVALSVFRVAETMRSPAGELVRTAEIDMDLAPNNRAAPSNQYAPDEPILPNRWAVWRSHFSYALPVIAALLVGFAFQMPAYYLTWGRFTLLTGLLLIGPALAAALDAWQNPDRFDAWVRLALLVSGLALTHYFALLLMALFLLVMGAVGLLQFIRRGARWNFLWRMAAFSLVGLALSAPWLWHVQQQIAVDADVQVTSPFDAGEAEQQRAADYMRYLGLLTGPRRNHILLAGAAAGMLAALRHPRRRFLVAWGLLLVLFSLPWGLRFPPFRPDHFAIVLFFPAALLLAGLLVDSAAALSAAVRPWLGGLALVGLLAMLLFWGMRDTRNILNPVTVFAGAADLRALDWVRENTPPDARFYINCTPWQAAIYRGVDGGFWLVPYTGRISLLPPVFYVWGTQEYVSQISDWAARAAELQGCTSAFWDLVGEARLTHVYLREGQGSLQPASLVACPGLRPVYQNEGITIYEINPAN